MRRCSPVYFSIFRPQSILDLTSQVAAMSAGGPDDTLPDELGNDLSRRKNIPGCVILSNRQVHLTLPGLPT
jgi:hypothetical protein